MAKTKLSEYSATAASNTDINSINIDEGMAPSSVNNALRELMAQLKNMEDGTDAVTAIKSGNIQITGNTISSTDTDGNVTISANGAGNVVAGGFTLPASDGSSGQVLQTNGSAALSFVSVAAFDAGTKMIFNQTSSPTGWTKDAVSNDDSALRVTTGTVGTGGSAGFATAMGTPAVSGSVGLTGDLAAGNLAVSVSGDISDTTLTTSQIPSHTHQFRMTNTQSSSNNTQSTSNTPERAYSGNNQGGFSTGRNLQSSGGTGGAHNHAHSLSGTMTGTPGVGNLAGSLSSATAAINVKYVDVIVATKD
jgi:microcystin-dependent protein